MDSEEHMTRRGQINVLLFFSILLMLLAEALKIIRLIIIFFIQKIMIKIKLDEFKKYVGKV